MSAISTEALTAIGNGCSGGVSWLSRAVAGRDVSYRYCCDEHDLAYYEGGSQADRALADYRFWACVRDSGRLLRAWIFWLAVRLFGWLYWNKA